MPASRHAALRSSIYKELFDELPLDERQEWIERADREHAEALQKFNKTLKKTASTAPEDRQRYAPDVITSIQFLTSSVSLSRIIECLSQFIQPVLDLLADHSGWKVSLIAGGPEPADGGRLHMIRCAFLHCLTCFID